MKKNISKKAIIEKKVKIVGNCIIEEGAKISGDCLIENAIIRKGAIVQSSYIISSEIGEKTTVGPFAHVKQNSIVGKNCRIGNFVEIKNSILKDGTKCAHLSYIGDAELGERVNVGCGVVFANYDGKKKHRSKVGNDVFIGCNCNLVAPRVVEDGAFIAAGTTVSKDLPKNSFCIGRSRETIKERKS